MVEYYFVLLSRETCERQYDFSKESNIITKRWKFFRGAHIANIKNTSVQWSPSHKDVLLQYTTIKIAQLINKAFVLDNSDMIYRKTVVDIILL